MALTENEKIAGRQYRADSQDRLDKLNALEPADLIAPHFIGIFRHLCAAKFNLSTAIELKERYLLSPIYSDVGVPAGRFGFIYREGRCRGCGLVARSATGRLVDAHVRPPLTGRVARS